MISNDPEPVAVTLNLFQGLNSINEMLKQVQHDRTNMTYNAASVNILAAIFLSWS